ncbi:Mut7-C RNAse domain-containing protein [Stetteria hydrogenophila]
MPGREPARFVVDAMLGDVARWLRLLGYDTLYSRAMKDWKLVSTAEETGRILVTRDRGLYWRARKRGLRAVYVEGDSTAERLAELAARAGVRLDPDPSRSRCPECNGVLKPVRDKEKLRGRVPPGALEAYDVFYVCTRCGRVYWEGSHWRNIRRVADEAKALAERIREARGGSVARRGAER